MELKIIFKSRWKGVPCLIVNLLGISKYSLLKKQFCDPSRAMYYRPVARFLLSLKSDKRYKDFRLILKFWLKIHSDFWLQCGNQDVLSLPSGRIGEQPTKLYPTRLSPRSWISVPGRGCFVSHSLLPMLQEFRGAAKLYFPYLVLRKHYL